MRTVIEMAREAGLHCAVLVYIYGKESALCDSEIEELRMLERFAELVRADERNSWPAEMEAMERQVNILTDALAQSRKPLTDDELADLWFKQSLDWMEFARAIEAAHGIKEQQMICNECETVAHCMKNGCAPKLPAQQKPVAWLDPWTQNNVTTDYDAYGKHGIPLYTSPPARKPLTDKQIAVIAAACGGLASDFVISVARAIEAKLRSKNT